MFSSPTNLRLRSFLTPFPATGTSQTKDFPVYTGYPEASSLKILLKENQTAEVTHCYTTPYKEFRTGVGDLAQW